jgi:hypothetical protein
MEVLVFRGDRVSRSMELKSEAGEALGSFRNLGPAEPGIRTIFVRASWRVNGSAPEGVSGAGEICVVDPARIL